MPTNQLFKMTPDRNFVIELLQLYGIQDFNDTHFFTKDNLDELNTVDNLNNILDNLNEYYIPCKAKTYLKDINLKRSIVILRQFLRCHNYTLYSKEKFINGVKNTVYQVIQNNDGISTPKKKDKSIFISFD